MNNNFHKSFKYTFSYSFKNFSTSFFKGKSVLNMMQCNQNSKKSLINFANKYYMTKLHVLNAIASSGSFLAPKMVTGQAKSLSEDSLNLEKSTSSLVEGVSLTQDTMMIINGILFLFK